MEKSAKKIIIGTLIIAGIILLVFFIITIKSGYGFWYQGKMEFEETGQSGDFIGGIVGTIFSAGAFFLLYLTLREQQLSSRKEQIEQRFFELLTIHRQNVDEMEFDASRFIESVGNFTISKGVHHGRLVYYEIFKQFTNCRNELRPFFNAYYMSKYTPSYEKYVNGLSFVKENGTNIISLALLDISFCIVFFGVGPEGVNSIKMLLKNKYDDVFVNNILNFISLKPSEDMERYKKWKYIAARKDVRRKIEITDAILCNRKGKLFQGEYMIDKDYQLIIGYDNDYDKYYSGHQFRLGHYFNHLLHTVQYINEQTDLSFEQKNKYINILRAQLSTYEQSLLFFYSLSQLGRKWEMEPEIDEQCKGYNKCDFELITKYSLIKNIPIGTQLGIEPDQFYKQVNYDTNCFETIKKKYH